MPGRDVMPKHRVFQATTAESVEQLVAVAAIRPWWVFRGQASRHRLTPKLERMHPQSDWVSEERRLIQDLQEATLGQEALPEPDDHLGWLGLLRHSEEPVRLLDFTRRLAVAVYFAITGADGGKPSVWAIDGHRTAIAWKKWLVGPNEVLRIESPFGNWREFNQLYPSREPGFAVMAVEPRVPNRRQELQSGLFLTGLNMMHSLEENLFGVFGHRPTDVIPERNAHGVLKGPMGVNTNPLEGSGLRRLEDAHVIKIELRIPEPELTDYLREEGVSAQTLGLADE